jgi:ABC-type nitrate/sulfonate/bicarbonate transport system ATPase subunit
MPLIGEWLGAIDAQTREVLQEDLLRISERERTTIYRDGPERACIPSARS